MPFESGLSRSWYNKGKASARSGRHADMYAAWHGVKGKPKTPGGRVTAQESFYQGFMDVRQGNPSKRKVQKRVGGALKKWLAKQKNPCKSLTLRNMAVVTVKRLPGGAVAVTGRKLAGGGRKR